MKKISLFLNGFWREPLWFKSLILVSLILSIVFSSFLMSDLQYSEPIAKLSAALFFGIFAYKFRMNRKVSGAFILLSVLCIGIVVF
ncbi:hypothetical protein [Pseudalkalibacillus berkeleyi]|uniref:YoqO-like protein n=1 Tax=Pseudalkalibacillus berkeleyi TaxID=1069813 RepID=A0ABS9H5Z2_9BACL|nr:hypothetical protein [Pseudalkalibacillus berkeleyi]MCF6139546.1 hypothetical protein [Pseudalkalibacillus berkeleyi]